MTEPRTHNQTQCDGYPCVVHNPSDHHMNQWPIVYRTDRAVEMPEIEIKGTRRNPFARAVIRGPVFVLAERTCPHGFGHPDPDSIAFARRNGGDDFAGAESVHGCDGCCRPGAAHQFTHEELAPVAAYYDTHDAVTGAQLPPDQWAHGSTPPEGVGREVSDEELDEILKGPLRFLPDDDPAVIELRRKFNAALDAQEPRAIVVGEEDDEDPAGLIRRFDAAMAAGEPVVITADPGEVCAHCGRVMSGYGCVDGKNLCHTGAMPPWTGRRDCYRLVTVYKHTMDGSCWCIRGLTDEEVGQLHAAEAGVGWHRAEQKALIPYDEPIWLALKPVEKTDGGVLHSVVVGYYDGDSFAEYSGLSLDNDVTHWAEIEHPRHPAR